MMDLYGGAILNFKLQDGFFNAIDSPMALKTAEIYYKNNIA